MRTIILTLVALVISASVALAMTVDINGYDYHTASPSQVYDFIQASNSSWDGGNNHVNIVDYILNGRLGDGDHTYTLVNGTSNANPTDTWFANGAASLMIDEIAGYAKSNTFGYYTTGNGSPTTHQIFAGLDGTGTSSSFTLSPAAQFGFYLGVFDKTYFTEAFRNDNEIHAAIFQEDKSNTYILGFEDLSLRNTDADYQDMIVKVNINTVPEPATMLLFGTGLVGFGLLKKRFKS